MYAPLYLDFCHVDEKLSLLEDVGNSARFGIVATRREGRLFCCCKGGITECGGGGCSALDICSDNLTVGINRDTYNDSSFARLVGIGWLRQISHGSVTNYSGRTCSTRSSCSLRATYVRVASARTLTTRSAGVSTASCIAVVAKGTRHLAGSCCLGCIGTCLFFGCLLGFCLFFSLSFCFFSLSFCFLGFAEGFCFGFPLGFGFCLCLGGFLGFFSC